MKVPLSSPDIIEKDIEAVIGAFSFVNKDVQDNVMAVGVPAKAIKKKEGE